MFLLPFLKLKEKKKKERERKEEMLTIERVHRIEKNAFKKL